MSVDTSNIRYPYQRLLVTIFKFYHRSTGIDMRTIYDQLSHFMEVGGGDRFREGQFSRENWRNTDFVWFNVDVWRDDRARSVIDTLSLTIFIKSMRVI